MTASNKNKKVLIIETGPGGLALAQILRKFGVEYEIFERDESQRDRSKAGLSLHVLRELLPSILETSE
ncbi:uncharacterized protein A1O9_06170 [Exophiala aquamarina CBS 119918]|uniref:FAD-binding domain-containing protein n=1 Tax=Exophiala aquamarina CBS 119918 TaxID=1182545 RepID=A0A072PDU1_9EURO|nr:uncharacterized protein A1O9_06170 [Exophiala aquamarina CBS 119918]KEF58244.1 hypothetical protein A1O9_06170 [Exophiala aquamarina CBS 119918]